MRRRTDCSLNVSLWVCFHSGFAPFGYGSWSTGCRIPSWRRVIRAIRPINLTFPSVFRFSMGFIMPEIIVSLYHFLHDAFLVCVHCVLLELFFNVRSCSVETSFMVLHCMNDTTGAMKAFVDCSFSMTFSAISLIFKYFAKCLSIISSITSSGNSLWRIFSTTL